MSARFALALIAGGLLLAACSGGGGGSSSTPQTAVSGGTATGVLVVALSQAGTSSQSRKPAFVSSATQHAAVFINFGSTNSGSTTTCTSTSCTITWSANLTTFPASYTFAVELDDGSTLCGGKACVLGEGSQSYTLVAGSNGTLSPPLPINGVAAGADFSSVSIAANVATTNFTITDADGVDITSAPGSSVFDNNPTTGVTVGAAPSSTTNVLFGSTTIPTFPYVSPNPTGSYSATAQCTTPYRAGTFSMMVFPGTPSGDITATELTGLNLSYPGSTIQTTSYTFNCDASGNITVGASGGVQISTGTSLPAFTISPTSLSLLAAGAAATATISDPSSYSGSYYMSSSAPNVASATVSGKTITVTAVGAGTATISATDTNGRTASISVQVTTTSFIGQ